MKRNVNSLIIQVSLLFVWLLINNLNVLGGAELVGEKSDLYILSIGIDKYSANKLGNLKFAKTDVEVIASEFEKRFHTDNGQVKKIVLLDEQASRTGIFDALEKLSLEITPNDVLIFNFSGYGNEIGASKLKEFYLFPSDLNFDAIEQTSISNTLLQAYFKKVRARRKLIILDSCKPASGYKSAESAFIEQDQKISNLFKENILFIGTDTFTADDAGQGHGTITQIVLDGLRGEADFDGDGVIRTRELEAYIYKGNSDTAAILPRPSRNVGMTSNFVSFNSEDLWNSPQTQLSPLAYAKRQMKTRSRNVLTSGDKPVLEAWRKPDGSLCSNSPFADALLKALRTNGGDDCVLTTTKIAPFIDKFTPGPQIGKLSGSDGVFVFVSETKKSNKNEER